MICGCSHSEISDAADSPSLESVKTARNDTAIYEHDFGHIYPGDEVSHRFEITNSTDIPWTVQEVQTDCSCTVPTISTKIFKPNESGWVDVVYHAGKLNTDDKRTVYVKCNEPGPTIPLTIKAKIREPISIVQKEIVFETSYRQQGKEYYVEVQNYDEHPWDALQLKTEANWFVVEAYKLSGIPPEAGLQETWRIVITPKAEHMEPDWYQELLVVKTDEHTKAIPIRLRVLPKVEITPELLFFGIVEPEVAIKKVLVLRFREDVEPQVEISTDLGNAIAWQWLKQEFPVWVLEVALTAESDTNIIDGMLTLKFSDTDIEEKNISIKAMIKR